VREVGMIDHDTCMMPFMKCAPLPQCSPPPETSSWGAERFHEPTTPNRISEA